MPRPVVSDLARPAGFEPATLGLAYQLLLSQPDYIGLDPRLRGDDTYGVSLWSGLSLHRLRCHTYSLYGSLRKISRFPRDCHQPGITVFRQLRFPRNGAIHSISSVSL